MCEGGEKCLKYLKRGWNRKEGRGNKDFKKGEQAGSRGGCLKKGRWNPLTNYECRSNKNVKVAAEYSRDYLSLSNDSQLAILVVTTQNREN